MADIKTHLRELSVATTIGLLKNGVRFSINDLYSSSRFFNYADMVISGDISSARNLRTYENFTGELRQIVDNGFNLGRAIYNHPHFRISSQDVILWLGNDTQREDPLDLMVGQYGFSLKEESFILENMGLYKLLNCYTGSNYRTRHIFSDYARTEYSQWFSATWAELVHYLQQHNNEWHHANIQKGKLSNILLQNNTIRLEFYKNRILQAATNLPLRCSLDAFESNTSSKTREEVFAKFINQELDSNSNYNSTKRACAVAASNALARELNNNLNYRAGLPRFLRIHDLEYYYAKTTTTGISIYKVPSLEAFGQDIVIESIVGSVPTSQANILTTIRNRRTNRTLTLRNECRFSHGQFNGTPEAKMYYENGGSLLTIYESID